MRRFIAALFILSVMGCSFTGLSKSPPKPIPKQAIEETKEAPETNDDEPVPDHGPVKPHPRKPAVDTPEKGIPNPCRDIADPDIYQEIRLKLDCIEENFK